MLLLLGLVIAGHAGRLLLAAPGAAPGELLTTRAAGDPDPAHHRVRAARLSRPLASGEVVEVNLAPAEEIARLPRIGMSLAKRIVEDRTQKGPFRGPGDLDRVPGVGSALLTTLHGKVSYRAAGGEVAAPPSDAKLGSSIAYGGRGDPGKRAPMDLNSATEADLLTLSGVGPARARAILAYRREKGSFAAVADLDRVPGFGRSLVARLSPLLTVR